MITVIFQLLGFCAALVVILLFVDWFCRELNFRLGKRKMEKEIRSFLKS